MENIYLLARTSKELINNLKDRCLTIADMFRKGENQEGNERLLFFLEDVNTLLEALPHISSTYPAISIEELNEKLTQVLEQMESNDYLYVADLLHYELQPLLDLWSGTINDG
ncbi:MULTISPECIES: hypothetical protein [Brevibacillus]|uniref:hypothetical protein n=1 Tax=Brevibacillus TaxID=55080 RepID=UPI000D0EFE4F|nr:MULTISPECIES: hypothetical protein [Brevibacillus]PSJ67299.1 hypothetical protein C7J99_21185 [Brevibacillus brevis]RED21641.1 hypothetical protein DES34_11968 [Brevibacillus brevis]TQK63083.1 hypothetical protein FB479_104402 [Brevibacillus sp. AG162]VEF86687.1 Uncharacterised protein [Brevibacillus brevis]GEC91890.1 hypothetical protein BBR01nite_42210 [Brevibacillus brevis]